jgi:hypothetical protein
VVTLEAGVVGVHDPPRRLDDLEGIGRRHQDLPQELIRIERDRCQELIELGRGIERSGLSRRRRCLRVE